MSIRPMVAHLAVADGGVAAGVSGQDPAQGPAAGAVHDGVAREGAMQVLLYLHVPVLVAPLAHLQSQQSGSALVPADAEPHL